MVISGTNPAAISDAHYYSDPEKDAGLWLGTIDDLWNFGKPTGTGGPWLNTSVQAGELSDPFLMLGFDEKELTLYHDSKETVSFELHADFTGDGTFKVIQVIQVSPEHKKNYEFPHGFSANWVRIKADSSCTVTATFFYN